MITIYEPMLARTFEDSPPTYPCFVQPKLDGIRCIVQWNCELGEVVAHSRNGKPLPLPAHIHSAMHAFFKENLATHKDVVFDGELYAHGLSFQEVMSRIKRIKSGIHPDVIQIGYHIYDSIDNELQFWSRHACLDAVFENHKFCNDVFDDCVFLVETKVAKTDTEALYYHQEYVKQGYEGSMLRNPDSFYGQGKRSPHLVKRKDWLEHDYEIVAIEEGSGKNEGTAVMTCKVAENLFFTVTAPGTYAEKALLFIDRDLHIGKRISIKYQELTDLGIPRFPIALGIKEDR